MARFRVLVAEENEIMCCWVFEGVEGSVVEKFLNERSKGKWRPFKKRERGCLRGHEISLLLCIGGPFSCSQRRTETKPKLPASTVAATVSLFLRHQNFFSKINNNKYHFPPFLYSTWDI